MEIELDEIDKKILTKLATNARKTTAPEIAKDVNVSPGTIRNRIKRMEDRGVIKGYSVDLDYEKLDRKFIELFKCSSPNVSSRDSIAKKALEIRGVVNVRKLNSGNVDVHVKAVAKSVSSLTKIAKELEDVGLDIVDESLLNGEYPSFSKLLEEGSDKEPIINLRRLESGAEIVDLSVSEESMIRGYTLEEAKEENILSDDVLVISIEREGNKFTPKGETELRGGDIISLFSTKSIKNELTKIF